MDVAGAVVGLASITSLWFKRLRLSSTESVEALRWCRTVGCVAHPGELVVAGGCTLVEVVGWRAAQEGVFLRL